MRLLRGISVLPITQKARGIAALEKSLAVRSNTAPHFLVQDEQDVANARKAYMYHDAIRGSALAVRPCPPRPRHGYFETERVLGDMLEAKVKELYDKVKQDDANAELLVARWQPAISSGILTPWSITVGLSNDGATSGRNARTLQLPVTTDSEMANQFWYDPHDALLGNSSPYIEFVRCKHERSVWLTQLRGGPNTSVYRTPDFIPPSGVKVKHVVAFSEEDYTLREWEEAVTKFAPGTVVYHKGGAITCHAGVHCVINNVPYVVTKEPKMGELLTPTSDERTSDPDAILYGIGRGMRPRYLEQYDTNAMAHMSVFALHNYAADHAELGSYLLGVGAAYTWKLIAAACIGEARHGRKHVVASPRGGVDKIYERFGYEDDRTAYYTDALAQEDDNDLEVRLITAMHSYIFDYWACGYGGVAWAECAVAALTLRDNIMRFTKKPTKNTLRSLSMAYNRAIHVLHNNGSPLGKFMVCAHGSECMTFATTNNKKWLLLDAAPSICDELTTMPTNKPQMPKITSTWRSTVPRDRVALLLNDAKHYHEVLAWERVAVETLAESFSGKRLKHQRCTCVNCSPHLHNMPCTGKCYEESKPYAPYCNTACNVIRMRVGLGAKACVTPNCDVCPGKQCGCYNDETCHKCNPSKVENDDKCNDDGCPECYPPDDYEEDYEEDNDDDQD